MTAQEIMFKIGSTFEGEGFKKASNTIKQMNGDVKSGAKALQNMSGMLGQMDTSASKTLIAVTGLAQAILTFNVTAIATQAEMFLINKYFEDTVARADAAKKKAEELSAAMQKAFSSALTDRMAGVKKEVADIMTEFEAVTKQANALTAALEGVRSSVAQGGVVNLQLEKLNKLLEAHGDAERANIEAAYNLKIAIEKSANTEIEWSEKVAAAHQARVDNTNRLAAIDQQLEKVMEERRSLEATMATARASADEHWHDIEKQVNALKEQEVELGRKRTEVENNALVLEAEEQKVKQDAINAQTSATIAVREAELAEQKLTEAKHNRQVKEEEARDAAYEKQQADILDAQEVKTAAQIQADANKAAQDLARAEAEYAKKLKEYQAGDLIREIAHGLVGNGGLKGGKNLFPVDVQKTVQMQVADTKVNDAIRNGAVTTVKDADRLQRQAMREARDLISKNQGQQLQEAQKYKRLQAMNPNALASSDKAFMEKYEKIQAAAEKRKQDLEQAKKAVDEAKDKTKETNETLKKIDGKLDKLGIK